MSATMTHPYHEGELLVQERAGATYAALRNGSVIRGQIPPGALGFVDRQSQVVLSSMDDAGRIWASVLFGAPGFLHAPDARTVEVDLAGAYDNPHDPFWKNIETDPRVGMLFIELGTRRRLRVNGQVSRDGDHLTLQVEQAYPNCPMYIQRRHLAERDGATGDGAPDPIRSGYLDEGQKQWIGSADTLFVASGHPELGLDASHRGGAPGFVQVLDASTLRIPDYPGNSMFNTFGNFTANPQAGVTFLDFESDRILQLVGTPVIRWDLGDPEGKTGGTGRFWDFEIDEVMETALPFRTRWEFLDYSPKNP